jgi:hypothetical protein
MSGTEGFVYAIVALVFLTRLQLRATRLEKIVKELAGPDVPPEPRGAERERRVTWYFVVFGMAYLFGSVAIALSESSLFASS